MRERTLRRERKITISAVAWLDLLGYGNMLRAVRFDPSTEAAYAAVMRLESFQTVAVRHATSVFRAVPVNDAVAFFRDLTPRSVTATFDFLRRAVCAFEDVNNHDKSENFPGARMIVALGPRIHMPYVFPDDRRHLDSIEARLSLSLVTQRQALNEAFRSRPVTGFVPELQANFAFTKAYLADESGSAAGLSGPRCYIDLSFFSEMIPHWVRFDERIDWSVNGMSASFGRLETIDSRAAGAVYYAGLNNAKQAAAALGISL